MAIKYGPIFYKVVNKPTPPTYPTVTVTNSGTIDFTLYDGQDETGESLQEMTAGSTFTATCTSGYLYARFVTGSASFTGTGGVSTGVNPAVVTADGTWNVAVIGTEPMPPVDPDDPDAPEVSPELSPVLPEDSSGASN